MKKIIDFFLLFSSTSTLICCAFPALMISIGAGSTMAFLSAHIPGFIWLSQNKVYLFIFAGFMLAFGAVLQVKTRNRECPLDGSQAASCQASKSWGKYIYFISLIIYSIGGFFAFIAPIII
jgi:TRAP-type C4-dicarboxylate transport system permease small subunit